MKSISLFAKLTIVLFLGVIFVIFVTNDTKDQKRHNISVECFIGCPAGKLYKDADIQNKNDTSLCYIYFSIKANRNRVEHSLIFFKIK